MPDYGRSKIVLVITLLVLLACTPIVIEQVAAVNTTEWDFTGYQGAIVLLGLVPFVWVASILIGMIFAVLPSGKGD